MSTYIINYSDPTKAPIEVSPNTVNTSTSIFFIGKNSIGYGELIAENFLHLLENFSSSTMPANPVEGQLWYDTTNPGGKILKVSTGAGNNWKPVSNTFIQETAPSTPADGDIWIDKSVSTWNFKVYQTDRWVSIGPAVSELFANTATISSSLSATGTVSLVGSVNISGTTNIAGTITLNGAASITGAATVTSITPAIDNSYSIGDPTARFSNIYGTNLYGEVNSISDARDKANVRNTILGLNFINALRPVDFNWDYRSDYKQIVEEKQITTVKRIDDITGKTVSDQVETKTVKLISSPKDGSKTQTKYHHGIIAQELAETSSKIGLEFGGYKIDEHGSFSVNYSELIAPMIKSIQELSQEVQRLNSIIDQQVGKI